METTRRCPIPLPVLAVGIALAFSPAAYAQDHDHGHDHGHGGHGAAGTDTKPHAKTGPVDPMARHGLIMALEGSDLVILGRMKMAAGVDEIMVKHGREMFDRGKAAVIAAESGERAKGAAAGDPRADSSLKSVRALVDAMENVLKELGKMDSPAASQDAMTMHHMHIALNHALEMAAEGANLAMIGAEKPGGGTDEGTVRHAGGMISDAKTLWKEILEGKGMKEIHARGMSMKMVPMMRTTHIFGNAGTKVLEILENSVP